MPNDLMESVDIIINRLNNILALSNLINTVNPEEATSEDLAEVGAIILEFCKEIKDNFNQYWQKEIKSKKEIRG